MLAPSLHTFSSEPCHKNKQEPLLTCTINLWVKHNGPVSMQASAESLCQERNVLHGNLIQVSSCGQPRNDPQELPGPLPSPAGLATDCFYVTWKRWRCCAPASRPFGEGDSTLLLKEVSQRLPLWLIIFLQSPQWSLGHWEVFCTGTACNDLKS